MTTYVLAMAFGPVGAFISAGRRSRDLWYGSRLLSEATRCAATSLQASGATLQVPLASYIGEPFWGDSRRGPVISNKILAIIPEGLVPTDLARSAELAARSFVAFEVERLQEHRRLRGLICTADLAAQATAIQQGDFLEVYGAWAPIGEGADAQSMAFERVAALLAARKTARVFTAPTAFRPGVPKSSLDAGRDSVLIDAPNERNRRLDLRRAAAGIRPDERLDGIGLARRMAVFAPTANAELGKLPFPSLARVALEPWLQRASKDPALLAVRTILEDLAMTSRESLFLVSSPVRDPGPNEHGETFPYDPEVFMEGRLTALERELRADVSEPAIADAIVVKARCAVADMKKHVASLHTKFSAPIPYYALIEADGDGIGHLLKQAKTDAERGRLVQALYDFAKVAWATVEEHRGCAFYVGGDELCAYVPADAAVAVVKQLSQTFADVVGTVAQELFPAEVEQAGPATLTAGVVIAHVHDDLRAVRGWTHKALERAKFARRAAWAAAADKESQRDGAAWGFVALEEAPRGGSNRRCCGAIHEIAARNTELTRLLDADHMSLSLAHDFLVLADEMAPAVLSESGSTGVGMSLARALLPQKLTRNNKLIEPAAKVQDRILAMKSWDEIREHAAEMLLAARISRVSAQRREKV